MSFARSSRTAPAFWAVLVAAAAAASATVPAADRLEPLHAALERPRVAGVLAAPAELRIGRAVIAPAAGSRLLVLEAEGTRVGWVLEGPSRLTYRVDDRYEVPIARRNLKHADGLGWRENGGAIEIADSLQGAAAWGWELELPAGEIRPAAGESLPAWLLDLLERRLDDNPSRDVLQSAYNGPASYRWAAFHSAGDDFVLDFDPRPAYGRESLARWRKVPASWETAYTGRFYAEGLVDQPTDRAWWDSREPEFVTTSTEIRAVNPARNEIRVDAKIAVRSLRDGLGLLTFSLLRETWDGDLRKRENRVTKLLVDGAPAKYLHTEMDSLLVALPRPLARDESVTLEVATEGDFLIRPNGDNYWRIGNEAWYPRPQRGVGREWSSFAIDVEVADPFVPFAPGRIERREKTTAGTRVVTRLDGPMEHAFLLAGKYTTVREEIDGRLIHVSSYVDSQEAEARRVARLAGSVQGCLETWLGVPYPFPELQMIEVNSWGWGQAPPGFVFITQEAFLNKAMVRGGVGQPGEVTRGINARIAHEVAHGWFPHVAKTPRYEEDWLSESFAEYVSAVCVGPSENKKVKLFWADRVREWKEYTKEADEGSIYLANQISDGGKGWARNYLLYGKGPLVLHALRQELGRQAGSAEDGDRLFMTWIRSYVKNFTFKTGETRHLVAILDQMTGKSWQPWFERYVYGTEVPKLDS